MTKIICPEPGSQLTIGSVTAPMTEPTPRTDKFREAEKEAAGPFEIAKVLNWTLDSHESLERSLARKGLQSEAMREAIGRAVEDLKKSDNMDEDAKPMKLIIADLEQA
jgi:hypothetical protein